MHVENHARAWPALQPVTSSHRLVKQQADAIEQCCIARQLQRVARLLRKGCWHATHCSPSGGFDHIAALKPWQFCSMWPCSVCCVKERLLACLDCPVDRC